MISSLKNWPCFGGAFLAAAAIRAKQPRGSANVR
jgi:hypothetical protein